MEPVVNLVGAAASIRAPSSGDLAHVLENGRMIAGEVIETLDGGTVVLGVAGRRVTAETQVKLEAGQHFLARAEGHGDTLVLRLIPSESQDESVLLAALRAVIGRELPAGELLDVLQSLASALPGDASPTLRSLLGGLAEHAFEPFASGSDLAATIARAGLDTEAVLLASSDDVVSTALAPAIAARDVAHAWTENWRATGVLPDDAELSQRIERILAAAIEDLARSPGLASELHDAEPLQSLARVLRAPLMRVLEMATSSESRAPALVAPTGFDARFLHETGTAEKLLALFGLAPRSALAVGTRDVLARDLKVKLLRAASELEDGATRDVIERSIDALEAEQLLHLARSRSGEPWHLTFAVPDGAHFVSAYVHHARERERDAEHATNDDASERFTLGIDFSQLGPIRADVFLRPDSLLLRLSVADAETATRLEARRDALCEDLAIDGRTVQISIAHSTDADLVPHAPAARFLTDHPLMDLSA